MIRSYIMQCHFCVIINHPLTFHGILVSNDETPTEGSQRPGMLDWVRLIRHKLAKGAVREPKIAETIILSILIYSCEKKFDFCDIQFPPTQSLNIQYLLNVHTPAPILTKCSCTNGQGVWPCELSPPTHSDAD